MTPTPPTPPPTPPRRTSAGDVIMGVIYVVYITLCIAGVYATTQIEQHAGLLIFILGVFTGGVTWAGLGLMYLLVMFGIVAM